MASPAPGPRVTEGESKPAAGADLVFLAPFDAIYGVFRPMGRGDGVEDLRKTNIQSTQFVRVYTLVRGS